MQNYGKVSNLDRSGSRDRKKTSKKQLEKVVEDNKEFSDGSRSQRKESSDEYDEEDSDGDSFVKKTEKDILNMQKSNKELRILKKQKQKKLKNKPMQIDTPVSEQFEDSSIHAQNRAQNEINAKRNMLSEIWKQF